ncbi:MAG: right-handed parallel beta-helix repeat-containing protein [Candidatus Lokiarchaeia archaeon]
MATYYVEVTGNDVTGDGSLGNPWLTVSHAVQEANPDSIIHIGIGEFRESFEINKNLTLIGVSRVESSILCPESVSDTTPMIRLVGAVTVRFENIHISGRVLDYWQYHGKGIFAEDGNARLEIENCDVMNISNFFIQVTNGELLVSNSRIGEDEILVWNSDVGIKLVDSQATITNVNMGNLIDHCIDLYGVSFAEVTHCTLNGSNTINCNGIRLRDTSSAHIEYNTIAGQSTNDVPVGYTQSGIQLMNQATADIHHNTIKGFAIGILFINWARARVWGNKIINNFNYGVKYPTLATEEGQPDLGGGYQGSPGENIIRDNGSLTGYGIALRGSGTCFARFNDWGTTNPADVSARITVIGGGDPEPTLDFLPFKQIPEPSPLDCILLLDQSGSMLIEGKWDSVKSACNVLASALSDINCTTTLLRLGLITFARTGAEDTHVWYPLSDLPVDLAHFSSSLGSPLPPWMTPMGEGLDQAREQFGSPDDDRRKYIFLLSDGKTNCGRPPNLIYPTFEQRINVYSVGFGDDSIDPEMLSEISNATLGDYVLTRSLDNLDLKRFFLNSLANPLGIGIVVNTCGSGVTTFPINEDESKMLVLIGWEDAALQMDFDLKDPNGNTITPEDLPDGFIYRTEDEASFASYLVESPAAGEWKILNVRRRDGGSPPEVCRFVAVDPYLVSQFWIDRGVSGTGRNLHLNARLLENGNPIDKVNVEVKVTAPKGSIGTFLVKHITDDPDCIKRLTTQKKQGRILQRHHLLQDFMERNKTKFLPVKKKRLRLKNLEHPFSFKESTGIFITNFVPEQEGTYTFEFVAEGKTKSNNSFRRTYIVSKYVSFLADPEKTQVLVKADDTQDLMKKGIRRFRLIVTPFSKRGDPMGPFRSDQIKFRSRVGKLVGEVHDDLDGSYWRHLLLKKKDIPDELSVYIGSVEVRIAREERKDAKKEKI